MKESRIDLRIDNDGYLVKRDGSLVFGFATVQNPYYVKGREATEAEKKEPSRD